MPGKVSSGDDLQRIDFILQGFHHPVERRRQNPHFVLGFDIHTFHIEIVVGYSFRYKGGSRNRFEFPEKNQKKDENGDSQTGYTYEAKNLRYGLTDGGDFGLIHD
jgi:hypothetical protein